MASPPKLFTVILCIIASACCVDDAEWPPGLDPSPTSPRLSRSAVLGSGMVALGVAGLTGVGFGREWLSVPCLRDRICHTPT